MEPKKYENVTIYGIEPRLDNGTIEVTSIMSGVSLHLEKDMLHPSDKGRIGYRVEMAFGLTNFFMYCEESELCYESDSCKFAASFWLQDCNKSKIEDVVKKFAQSKRDDTAKKIEELEKEYELFERYSVVYKRFDIPKLEEN